MAMQSRGARAIIYLVLAALMASCSEPATQPGNTNSLTITPPAATVATRDTVRLDAILKDASGNVLAGHPVTWVSNNLGVATVSGSGLVTGVHIGQATVTASSEGTSSSATVTVLPPVASVTVTPDTGSAIIGQTIQLAAKPKDADGNVLSGLAVAWGSNRPDLGTVSPTGLVTGVAMAGSPFYYYTTVLITAAIGGTSGTATIAILPNVESVTVSPGAVNLVTGSSVQLAATTTGQGGYPLSGRPVTWMSDHPPVATVSNTGLVTAVSHGSAIITATSEGKTGTAQINLVRVASVNVVPETVTVVHGGGRAQLTATLTDSAGDTLTSGSVNWSGSSPAVATVAVVNDRIVSVTGAATGTATIRATSGAANDSATIVVQPPLSFAAVNVGATHTCALTAAGAAYCWGPNGVWFSETGSLLGTGSRTGPEVCSAFGTLIPCSTAPTTVTGGLTFAEVRPGRQHTCGLTTAGAAYCWGVEALGGLGIGTLTGLDICGVFYCSSQPLAVVGGLTFVALSSGGSNSCGITADSLAYCWGGNRGGELGIGTTTGPDGPDKCASNIPCSTTPVAVSGGIRFSALSIGTGYMSGFMCGLASDSTAYCWGDNFYGTLGDGTTNNSSVPIPVSGGLRFTTISAALAAVCGLTAEGTAYCWGTFIGGGPPPHGTTPTAVSGGLTFTTVSSGNFAACGLTPSGAAYCWDENMPEPAAVPGGLAFASISLMHDHVCGRTTGGTIYCWGSNALGQLGDGTTTDRAIPVKVLGQP